MRQPAQTYPCCGELIVGDWSDHRCTFQEDHYQTAAGRIERDAMQQHEVADARRAERARCVAALEALDVRSTDEHVIRAAIETLRGLERR